jgi:cbb3-type cytochrome oxidase subunit 3
LSRERGKTLLVTEAGGWLIMEKQAWAYFLFGLALVVLFVVIIVHYYSKKRHTNVEEVKYKMLDDE